MVDIGLRWGVVDLETIVSTVLIWREPLDAKTSREFHRFKFMVEKWEPHGDTIWTFTLVNYYDPTIEIHSIFRCSMCLV